MNPVRNCTNDHLYLLLISLAFNYYWWCPLHFLDTVYNGLRHSVVPCITAPRLRIWIPFIIIGVVRGSYRIGIDQLLQRSRCEAIAKEVEERKILVIVSSVCTKQTTYSKEGVHCPHKSSQAVWPLCCLCINNTEYYTLSVALSGQPATATTPEFRLIRGVSPLSGKRITKNKIFAVRQRLTFKQQQKF